MAINSAGIRISGKGSITSVSSSGSPTEIPVGTNNTILTTDLIQTGGLSWLGVPPNSLVNFSSSATIQGSITPGTVTYASQVFYYGRIGTIVVCFGVISWNAFDGTGDLQINLPFPSSVTASVPMCGACLFDGAFSASGDNCSINVSTAVAFATIQTYGSGAGPNTQACVSSGDLEFTLIYITD